eukprot:5897236-Pleurochrysis_carterae.AAC.1
MHPIKNPRFLYLQTWGIDQEQLQGKLTSTRSRPGAARHLSPPGTPRHFSPPGALRGPLSPPGAERGDIFSRRLAPSACLAPFLTARCVTPSLTVRRLALSRKPRRPALSLSPRPAPCAVPQVLGAVRCPSPSRLSLAAGCAACRRKPLAALRAVDCRRLRCAPSIAAGCAARRRSPPASRA